MDHCEERSDRHQTDDEEITWYLRNLASLPALSMSEEAQIVQRIARSTQQEEVEAARTLLIEGNLRLVIRLARCYQHAGVPLADLIQEGNLALVQAAQQFHPQSRASFRAFASRRMHRALDQLVEEHLTINHIPDPEKEPFRAPSAQEARALACDSLDGQRLASDLPEERFISLDALLRAEEAIAYSPADDGSSGRPSLARESDPCAVDTALLAAERRACIVRGLSALDDWQRSVLIRRYLLEPQQSLSTIAQVLQITEGRARRIEQEAIRNIRRCISHEQELFDLL